MDNCPLVKVELQTDVFMVCLQHALSTENFEVMGLLIGNTESGISKISAVIILRRSDKKKDRVEISPEQLLEAAVEAERLSEELKRPMRVLGWYHSHPHITVCPSRVDVNTQATYQMIDSSFVGLIFAVFAEDKGSKGQTIVLTCFQSHNNKAQVVPLEIEYTTEISNRCLKTMTDLPTILIQEEDMAKTSNYDVLTDIHNHAVKTQALVHISDIITKPLLLTFEYRIALNKLRVAYLKKEFQELKERYFLAY